MVNQPCPCQLSLDLFLLRAVKCGRQGAEAEFVGCPAEVCFQDLTDVHSTRDTQGVHDQVDRCAILKVRHIGDRHDLRDHALVSVTASHLVAFGRLALLGHRHAHHFLDAGRQITVLFACEYLHVDDLAALAVRHAQ